MPSDMDDPDIIATLIATGSDLAKRAFQFDHNRQRYLPPIHANDVLSSRENTPVISEETDDDGEDDEYEHRLVLSFRSPPKDPARGFVFGAGSECDVKLADRTDIRVGEKRKIRRISQVHFSIGFDAYRRVVLQDTSVNGTIVSYDGHAQKESRTNFLWIIAPGWKTIEISIPGAELAFQIQLGIHETCEAAFLANVDTHFPTRMGTHERSLAYPMLQLGVQSRDTSVATSGAATPRRGPIYLLRGEIGRGTFGRVYKVVDVSSGAQYAGKTFEGSRYEREVAILRSLKHVRMTYTKIRALRPSLILRRNTSFLSSIFARSPLRFLSWTISPWVISNTCSNNSKPDTANGHFQSRTPKAALPNCSKLWPTHTRNA